MSLTRSRSALWWQSGPFFDPHQLGLETEYLANRLKLFMKLGRIKNNLLFGSELHRMFAQSPK